MFIIAYGNMIDGMIFVGPFEDHELALEYANKILNRKVWNVIQLDRPERLRRE